MQIHQLQPIHKVKKPKRVGRGGKKGTYSGRGGKGQTARAGRKMEPFIREIIKRYPKLKGYRAFSIKDSVVTVSVSVLEVNFQDGEIVDVEHLIKKGIIRAVRGKHPSVKILGNGILTKKLVVSGCHLSKGAMEAVKKAGGVIK